MRNPSTSEKELHDCFDCKGCLCEDICKKYEEEAFPKKRIKKDTKKDGD